jgi:hypothetical protein
LAVSKASFPVVSKGSETQPTPTARTLLDQKLMPECNDLCLQNGASSETISQREEYGQHSLGRLPVATL